MHHSSWFVVFVLIIPSMSQAQRQTVTAEAMWKLDRQYADSAHGVTFLYPSTWTKTKEPPSYHAPALLQASQLSSPIAFTFSEGGFPRTRAHGPYTRTTLEAVDIVYAAQPLPNSSACEKLAMEVSDHAGDTRVTLRMLNGLRYSVRQTNDTGMNQFISGLLYSRYERGACYLFETDTAGVDAGVDTQVHTLRKHDYDLIDSDLLSIMQTVHIRRR